jgi:F-type H+-transporting ATPase subunit gamma
MPTVRDLRDRIRSLRNTQQITKAMKQVAAARIRRAEMLQKQSRPYAGAIGEMLRDLIASVGAVDHPFMRPGAAGAAKGIVVMTADKGLAGAFNSNVIRAAESLAREDSNVRWYAVGNKARNAVRKQPQDVAFGAALSAVPKIETARAVAASVTEDFYGGRISEIVLVSSQLVSMMSQRPAVRRIVPISAELAEKPSGPRADVEFAPSPESVLSRLLPKYLEFTLYAAMLETDAAFFAAQLIAMSNATENAGKLIDEFTIAMNKARQAAITKEILEIVGGAEALTG